MKNEIEILTLSYMIIIINFSYFIIMSAKSQKEYMQKYSLTNFYDMHQEDLQYMFMLQSLIVQPNSSNNKLHLSVLLRLMFEL